MNFEHFLTIEPYALEKDEKEKLLTDRLKELTKFHRENCVEYEKILKAVSYQEDDIASYKEIPFLPVRLFKELSLKSVPQEEVVKTMTSSGTSGQSVSKIYLDRQTSSNQQKAMVKIVNSFTGSSRMPMIILDCPSVIKNRSMFSARGAGILGFSIFGTKKIYALQDDMQLNVELLREFLEQHKGERILLFGFTFMVWQYFYKELLRLKENGESFDLSNGILIHGGGWKKLVNEAVSHEEFHDRLKDVCGLERIHDYYGMVEQTGCIYMQCECGHLHASIFSDVIVRRPDDFSECNIGEKGILQVVSTIPESYPGHSLLTEDEGVILGEDDCPCGRKGKYFKIIGRLKNAEIRGCSDTFAADYGRNVGVVKEKADNSDDVSKDCLERISYLVGSREQIQNIKKVSPLSPFDEKIVECLNELSKALLADREARKYSDVVTLGFWLRKASLLRMKERFSDNGRVRVGRGVVFHIAPSNVPVNYAYSLFTGLLCGNANIVRVPSKEFPQISTINIWFKEILEMYPDLKSYVILIRYEREREINDKLSSLCDTRVVWGGDLTIEELRKSPLAPRATEITFADRYSFALVDADYYLNKVQQTDGEREAKKIAQDFYNDTYLSDQNACTSPRVVVWYGKEKARAKQVFWENLMELVKNKYRFQPIQGVDKLTTEYLAAAKFEINEIRIGDNRLVRNHISKLSPDLMNYRGNSGFFYEYDIEDIMEIRDFCDDTHCQTIGILGDPEMIRPLLQSGIRGVDRVVSIGHTMDFDLVWDGYDLVDVLTRKIAVQF